ncbi:MAG: hypothetical protein Q9165_007388 [Trypethelium subeluteriae]
MADSTSTSILSFPPQTFAALSPSAFLHAHLNPTSSQSSSLRPNHRSPIQFRVPNINTSSLSHANGSAVVRLGNTAVVCGVRGEILKAEDIPKTYNDPAKNPAGTDEEEDLDYTTVQDLGLLVPNIELSTGCAPQHIPGNAPSAAAQSLAHRLRSLLYTTRLIQSSDLRIWSRPADQDIDIAREEEGTRGEDVAPRIKAYWTLYIDVLFIALDGGAFDAAWGATIAALRDTKLPGAWWDVDREIVLCSDQSEASRQLNIRGLPVSAGLGIFVPEKGKSAKVNSKRRVLRGLEDPGATHHEQEESAEAWLLADMDAFEEELCQEQITVVLDCSTGKTKILKVEKNGGNFVDIEEMKRAIRLAEGRWIEWKNHLEASKR